MNYETQEEFEHFEGAMEQSVPQEECHCGKDGHALCSINCPVHSVKKRMEALIGSKSSDYNKGVQDCINILGI